MDSSFLLGLTTFAYLGASFLYVAFCLYHADKIGKAATVVTVAALALQTAGIGLRWWESYRLGFGHAPLTNMYESVVFFSWAIGLFYLILTWKYRARILGAFAAPLAFLAMAYASFTPGISRAIAPLIPALQSNWLIAHVVTCFIGYAGFAVAAALGCVYLLKERAMTKSIASHLPERDILDDLIHKTLIFGFIWLSAGIITGAVWADSAWGTYWSWDPKETWSLITWFFYAITLHARYTRGWNGARIAWMAIIGLFCVLFTYYGVNFLLSGLHSYGSN
ncbi:MAG: c-type cytochrome biogenesis protein CcsB [Desulfobulbaceae bacterium]|jgi:cytochrome c-type biogenesis protein CcsB|nr:c-type cytochrome biogenesis protein CcsB [Desulfobulbaceae bacterium]